MKASIRVLAILWLCVPAASADAIIDWNIKGGEVITGAELPPPLASRVMALMHNAAYEAGNAVTRRYSFSLLHLKAEKGVSLDAAIAAACHSTLAQLVPAQKTVIDNFYAGELAKIADGPAKLAGVSLGEQATRQLLELRADPAPTTPESYRPATTPGVYVPTVIPAVPQWPARVPWNMSSASQLRPGPPPALTSEVWARDYNEIKLLGAKASRTRTDEQTAKARFWETTRPTIYFGLVRSVAAMPGRDVMQNVRLFALATQAADDALIAVFDAKYHYAFWRPITAIRNGDQDGNDATERDPSWRPFIDTPMHPEYPCAHCIVAAAYGGILKAEVGTAPMPTLSTTSPTADEVTRSWTSIDAFVQEVSDARVYDGVHFRNSTEVARQMGWKIAELTEARYTQRK